MTRNAPARFQWRAFVTLSVTLGFLALAASGVMLYVAPRGRVADWSLWTLGALDRHQWQSVHTVFALVFLVAGAFHLWFNLRALLFYVRSRLGGGRRHVRELAVAGAAAVAVAGLTLADLPPFASVPRRGRGGEVVLGFCRRRAAGTAGGASDPRKAGRHHPDPARPRLREQDDRPGLRAAGGPSSGGTRPTAGPRGPSPAPTASTAAGSSWPTGARSSSTRSATCPAARR